MAKAVVRLGALSLVLAFALGACGGSSEDVPDSANENALAESMLLMLSDFPTGWAEEPDDDDDDNPFDECDPGDPQGRKGSAETGAFSSGGTDSVSEQLGIFETPDQVSRRLDDLRSRGECAVEVINSGKLDNDEAAFGDASFSPLSFPVYGDRTEAFRVKYRVVAKGETGLGSEADVFIDVTSVQVGRVGFSISVVGAFTPFDSDELEDYVSIAEARVGEKLAANDERTSSPPAPRATSPEDEPTYTPERAEPTSTPEEAEPRIGDDLQAGSDLTITVFSYNAPIASSNEFLAPDEGNVYAAIDVEGCTGPNPGDDVSLNPFDFRLQLPDNTRLEPDISAKEPALNRTPLTAEDCVRGFVTFQVPDGVTPRYVVYEGRDSDFDQIIIKWALGPGG